MVEDFKSINDLYKRVKPALEAKLSEAIRTGYKNIKITDIWNYLIENKWKKSNNLMLSDVVDNILNTDLESIDNYVKEKENKPQDYNDDIAIF